MMINNVTFEQRRDLPPVGGPNVMQPLNDDEVKLVGSRLYVGNINDKTTRINIENRFSKYGRVIGVTMHEDCCYVQYEDDKVAQLAIKGEHGSIMFGNKLEVRMENDERSNHENMSIVQDDKSLFIPPGSPSRRRRSTSVTGRRELSRERPRESSSFYRSSYRDRSPSSVRSSFDDGPRGQPSHHRVRDHLDDDVGRGRSSKANDCEIVVMNTSLRSYAQLVERKLTRAGLRRVDVLYSKDDNTVVRLLKDISSRGCLYAIIIQPQNEVHNSITVNILYGTPQEHRNMPLEDAVKFISINFEMHSRELAARRITEKLSGPSVRQPQSQLGFNAGNNPVVPPYAAPQQPVLNSRPQQQQQQRINLPQQQQISNLLQQKQQQQANVPQQQQVNFPQQQQQQQPLNNQSLRRFNNEPQQHLNSHIGVQSESDVQTLIQILANGKQLTVMELDRVIKHLEETRNKLIASNSGTTYSSDPAHPRQHLELQQKIKSLFGGPASSNDSNIQMDNTGNQGMLSYDSRGDSGTVTDGSNGVSRRRKGGEGRWGPPIKPESPTNSGTSLNFNLENPNVQKALDNLLQSGPNILKCLDMPEDRERGYANNSSRVDQSSLDRPYSGGMPLRNRDLESRNMPLISTPPNDEMSYMTNQREQDSRNRMQRERSLNQDSRNTMQMERSLNQDSRNFQMESQFQDIDSRDMAMGSSDMDFDRYNRGLNPQRDGLHGDNIGQGNVNLNMMRDADRYESLPVQGRHYQGQQGPGPYNQRPMPPYY